MALLPLLVALGRVPRGFERPRPFRTFLLGWITGITYFWGTLYWLIDVMVVFGGLAYILAVILAGLLILYLALFPAMFAVIVGYARRQLGVSALLIAPAVWTATELGRGFFPDRLPLGAAWQQPGDDPSDRAARQRHRRLRTVGAGRGAGRRRGLRGSLRQRRSYFRSRSRSRASERLARWSALGAVGVLIAGVALWGQRRVDASELLRQGTPLKVGVVQGNIAQQNKWQASWRDRILTSYLDMSTKIAREGVSLIVWPEASMPFLFEEDPMRAAMVRQVI